MRLHGHPFQSPEYDTDLHILKSFVVRSLYEYIKQDRILVFSCIFHCFIGYLVFLSLSCFMFLVCSLCVLLCRSYVFDVRLSHLNKHYLLICFRRNRSVVRERTIC